MVRPSTPPPLATSQHAAVNASPPTPAATRKLEESRLRAKDLRSQREAAARASGTDQPITRSSSGFVNTEDVHVVAPGNNRSSLRNKKRPFESITQSHVPESNRDARSPAKRQDVVGGGNGGDSGSSAAPRAMNRKFARFVDYNFSNMTDTKGGFLSTEDDPFNKSLGGGSSSNSAPGPNNPDEPQRPKHMTEAEWERMQLLRKLQKQKSGPFEPGLSAIADKAERKKCRECGNLEIDWVWEEVFGCCVCGGCKDKFPEKYSLLTKTECREDYLITDPELRDKDLLPHLSRPNPHKTHWHDMMLFLRYQVEEYAFGTKWGSAEALDAEFARREAAKKKRKEEKFRDRLLDLKKKTRADAFRRGTGTLAGGDARFGEGIAAGAGVRKHVHEWGRAVVDEASGMSTKSCVGCGMEVEEFEL
ncbi:mutagen sensitive-43 [Diaporthe helianthi]|uniref:DNA repair protein RAD14 n=1 Tax=Diaporthe helianthi TaxID=158607 RepID=A0A2P5I4I6_DIAHE|nr:mutagen sensitive-43 [Diaporthe helianthi]